MNHSTFAINLRKVRKDNNLTQGQLSTILNIKRATYQAYEEGRSMPPIEVLFNICESFGIENIKEFITNNDFDINKEIIITKSQMSLLEKKYLLLPQKHKEIVNLLLGLK